MANRTNELKKQLIGLGIKVEGNYVKRSDIKKYLNAAVDPWDNPETDEETKKSFQKQYSRTKFKLNQLKEEFKDKAISLVITVQSYLTDAEECPDHKDMVMIPKNFIDKILKETENIEKLKKEWLKLDRQYTDQLISGA